MIQKTATPTTTSDCDLDSRSRVFFRRSGNDLPVFRADDLAWSKREQSAPQKLPLVVSSVPRGFRQENLQPVQSVSWDLVERGLMQRFEALQVLMERLAAGRALPASLQITGNSELGKQFRLLAPGPLNPHRPPASGASWTWFGATDLVLTPDGGIHVLDQDFSLPTGLERLAGASGCSLEAAEQVVRTALFPDGVHCSGEPSVMLEPTHPGAAETANSFLARCLQIERVHRGHARADNGGFRVLRNGRWDVVRSVVRRVEDELLDPNCLRPNSLVGVPGLMGRWSAGRLSLFNAPGSGLFRLRSLIRRMPLLIRELLAEEPVLKTAEVLEFECEHDAARVLRQPHEFVLRPIDPLDSIRSCCGRTAGAAELERVLEQVRKQPARWCARRLLPGASTGQHFRVFASSTDRFRILPAGLMRKSEADGGASPLIPTEAEVTLL